MFNYYFLNHQWKPYCQPGQASFLKMSSLPLILFHKILWLHLA